MGVILLEYEEDIRLAAKIIARNNGFIIKTFAGWADYADYACDEDIIISSCRENGGNIPLIALEKPYDTEELISALKEAFNGKRK